MEEAERVREAVEGLKLDVPYYRYRMVGGRVELHLYGGAVVCWPQGSLVEPAVEGLPAAEAEAVAASGEVAPGAVAAKRSHRKRAVERA